MEKNQVKIVVRAMKRKKEGSEKWGHGMEILYRRPT